MSGSKVVSDTGPLISFEKLPDGFEILRRLEVQVVIPPAVLVELQAGSLESDYLAAYGIADRVEVVAPRLEWGDPAAERLDAGERAAIGLALERGLPLLIEERLGRRIAQQNGVPIAGAAGLILRGFRQRRLSREETQDALRGLLAHRRIGSKLMGELLQHLDRGAAV